MGRLVPLRRSLRFLPHTCWWPLERRELRTRVTTQHRRHLVPAAPAPFGTLPAVEMGWEEARSRARSWCLWPCQPCPWLSGSCTRSSLPVSQQPAGDALPAPRPVPVPSEGCSVCPSCACWRGDRRTRDRGREPFRGELAGILDFS